MAIDRTNYNALVDDDGSNLVGTPWTKTIVKTVLLDPIDAAIAAPGTVGFANGAVGAPSITFASQTGMGLFRLGGNTMQYVVGGSAYIGFQTSGLSLNANGMVSWSNNGATPDAGQDLFIGRDAANTFFQKNGNADQLRRSYAANGGYWERGSASELLTLSTGGATTDTSANLLPANAIIEAVVARVTTTITTATDWKLGDATIAGRFSAANATLVAGTTQVGLVHVDLTGTSGPRQTAAAKVRVTTTGTPGAGAIRIVVFYRKFIPPTS